MVNLGDIKAAVRANGSETDNDARVVIFANRRQRAIINRHRWRFMRVTTTVAAVAGTSTYNQPTSPVVHHLESIRLATTGQNSYELRWVPDEELLQIASENSASAYNSVPAIWSDVTVSTFQVFPAPAVAGTFTIRYLKNPTDLAADGDVPDIPSEYLDVLVAGISADIAKRERRFDAAAAFEADFEALLDQMRSQYEIRQVQSARHVRIADERRYDYGSAYGGWLGL